jgi:hypothetical protein
MTECLAAVLPGILCSVIVGLPMMWLRCVFAGISGSSSVIETWLRLRVSWAYWYRLAPSFVGSFDTRKSSRAVGVPLKNVLADPGGPMGRMSRFVAVGCICTVLLMNMQDGRVLLEPHTGYHGSKGFLSESTQASWRTRSITLDGFEPSHAALRRMGMRNEFNSR